MATGLFNERFPNVRAIFRALFLASASSQSGGTAEIVRAEEGKEGEFIAQFICRDGGPAPSPELVREMMYCAPEAKTLGEALGVGMDMLDARMKAPRQPQEVVPQEEPVLCLFVRALLEGGAAKVVGASEALDSAGCPEGVPHFSILMS